MKDIQYCIIETDTNEESKLIVKVPNTFSDNDHSRKYTVLTSTKILSDAYLILFNCFLFLFSSPSFQNYINYHLEQKFADFLFNYVFPLNPPRSSLDHPLYLSSKGFLPPPQHNRVFSSIFQNHVEFRNDIDILKKMLKYSSTYPSPVQQHHPLYCLVIPSSIFWSNFPPYPSFDRLSAISGSILLDPAGSFVYNERCVLKQGTFRRTEYRFWNLHQFLEPSFSEASQYLYSAIPINPLNPLPRSYIAELSSLKESWFDSIYNYFLSLDIGSGFEAREKLGSLFEKARQELVNLEALKKKKKTLREMYSHSSFLHL